MKLLYNIHGKFVQNCTSQCIGTCILYSVNAQCTVLCAVVYNVWCGVCCTMYCTMYCTVYNVLYNVHYIIHLAMYCVQQTETQPKETTVYSPDLTNVQNIYVQLTLIKSMVSKSTRVPVLGKGRKEYRREKL